MLRGGIVRVLQNSGAAGGLFGVHGGIYARRLAVTKQVLCERGPKTGDLLGTCVDPERVTQEKQV